METKLGTKEKKLLTIIRNNPQEFPELLEHCLRVVYQEQTERELGSVPSRGNFLHAVEKYHEENDLEDYQYAQFELLGFLLYCVTDCLNDLEI